MNVPEYLAAKGMSINALCKATGIAYTTLHPHVRDGKRLSLPTAQKLERFSGGEMAAGEILGLTPRNKPPSVDGPARRKKARRSVSPPEEAGPPFAARPKPAATSPAPKSRVA